MSKPGTEASVPMPDIVKTPGVLGGKARIEGHRIGVHHIVELVIHGDHAVENVAAVVYPNLSIQDVHAALGYYYRHRQEIDSLLDSQEPRDGDLVDPKDIATEGS